MSITTTLLRKHVANQNSPTSKRVDRFGRDHDLPEPPVERIQGLKLVALWLGLIAGAWGIAAGVGYGFYIVVQSIFF